jgi:ubiquinone/menaquinone biosynthesis C-methylase UbiE
MGMIKSSLRRIIDYSYLRYRKGKILDIGCGDGAIMIGKCIGIDIDPENIKKAKLKDKKAFLANAESIGKFKNMDTVTCVYVLHHADHPIKILKHAHFALKKGGKFLIVESSKAGLDWKGHTYMHEIKSEWLIKQLTKLGFNIERRFNWFGRTTGVHFSKSYVIIATKK